MNNVDKQYLELLQHVLDNGEVKTDRTGTGTISYFGYQTRYNLQEGFPLLTTKKMPIKGMIHELLWFLRGHTTIQELDPSVHNWWKPFADEDGKLGPIYGKQWRHFQSEDCSADQIRKLIQELKNNPDSRRHLVTAWNPAELFQMALPPCHCLFQFYVFKGNKLSCQLYQRSADLFLGVPVNIVSYALLTHIIASHCGYEVGEFIHTLGDAHIYLNHVDQVKEQLTREPKALPELFIKTKRDLPWDHQFEDFEIIGYNSHPAIKGEMSV